MKLFTVAYRQYGQWKLTVPFETELAAERHARLYLRTQIHLAPEFRENRTHNECIQILEIEVTES